MNAFTYDIPVKVYFGENQLTHLGEELRKFGKRVLLVYGGGSIKKNGLYDAVVTEIKKAGLELFELSGIAPNPKIDSVRQGTEICKEHQIDVVLAVGGGSTIDAAKIIAAGACVDFDPWKFLSENAPVEKALPVMDVLTVSATGSEMDCAAVISNPETQDKLCRIARPLQPRVSFLDPTNTYSVSPYQTACGSADILSHIIEVYFNMKPDLYMLDCFMEGMMKTVIKFAPIALKEPENYEARANLMWAASWAINGFINGGKQQSWSCHAMEHELSAFYDITHGLGLAILTPRWMEYCLSDGTVSKYAQFGINVFGIDADLPPMEIAKKSIEQMKKFLYETLGLKSTFHDVGIDDANFRIMAQKASAQGLAGAFVPLAAEDVEKIYSMCR